MKDFISLAVNAFDDERLILLEAMPAGDALVVVWLKLVFRMGQNGEAVNACLHYGSAEELAAVLRVNVSTMRAAIQAMQDLGMIELVPGGIKINGGGSLWA